MNKFFIYSREQHDLRVSTELKMGRKYVPGSITVSGVSHKFTEVVSSISNIRYNDAIVVYEGDPSSINYILPKTLSVKR